MEPDDADHSELEVAPLDPLAPGQSRRDQTWRWLRSRPGRLALSVVCGLLLVGAFAALFSSATSNPSAALDTLLNVPTPTATIPMLNDEDAFFVTNTVPWGTLKVDGASPIYSQISNLGRGFRLSRGVHHIVYQARLFPTVRCTVSVPRSARDTCPLADTTYMPGVTFERMLDLQAIPQRLASTDYNTLVVAVMAQLNRVSATDTIQPGERYYSQDGQLAVASAPLTFTASLTPSPSPDANCLALCEPVVGPASSTAVWQLETPVSANWTVTDSTGARTTSSIPNTAYGPTPLSLAVTRDGDAWHVQIEDDSPLGSVMSGIASQAYQVVPSAATKAASGLSAGAAENAAQGAYIVIATSGAGDPAGSPAILFWRFGVLLAVNPEAEKAFPTLPIATTYEQQIAMAAEKGAIV